MANLPVPTLASEIPNNVFTAALARAGIYNTGTFLLNPPLFVGTQATAQSIPNAAAAWTAISLDSSQVDSYSGHSNSTNNSRYTAQVGGLYAVCGVSAYPSNGTGVRGTRLHLNASVVQGTAQMGIAVTSGSGTVLATPVRTIRLNIGDYVEVATYQSSGAALNTIVASDMASALWVCWAGT